MPMLQKFYFVDCDPNNPPFGVRNARQLIDREWQYFTAVAYNERGEFLGHILINQEILQRLVAQLPIGEMIYLVTDTRHVLQTSSRQEPSANTFHETVDPRTLESISEFFVRQGFAGVYNHRRHLGKKSEYTQRPSGCTFRVISVDPAKSA